MTADRGIVPDLAGAVLDRRPIDWEAATSSTDLDERPVLDELRVRAAVVDFHRQLPELDVDALALSGHAFGDDLPQDWGHLRIRERIGRGAFGEVFRAWDTRLDREVALKLLTAEPTENRAGPERAGDHASRRATTIIEQGRLLARVRHPNLATIYDAERIDDRVGLWMELVNGRTLEQMLATGKVFRSTEAIRIGIEVCRGMSAVHRAGLIHGDIKAQNVMVAEDARVVLMDFGTGFDPSDSSPATLAGTPLYLAPELFDGREATVQSDIYSVGVLLYHILTGSYPVEAASFAALRQRHQRLERRSLRTARPDAPVTLASLVDRAIDPRPERRYRSADDFARALAALETRSRVVRFAYAAATAAALVLVSWVTLELRHKRPFSQDSIRTGPSAPLHGGQLTTLIGNAAAPEKLAEILTALQAEPGKRIADVGTGEGLYSLLIARAVGPTGRVTAVDIVENNLENLRARLQRDNVANVDLLLAAVDDTRLPDNTFDAVLIYNAYHEMPMPEPVLRSIFAALRPGGRLVMSEPIHDEMHGDNMRTATRAEQVRNHEISPDVVQQELQAAGFEVIELRPDFLPFSSLGHKGGFWLLVARKASAR